MNFKKYALLSLLAGGSLVAQEQKKNFTMSEAVIGLYTNLRVDNINRFAFSENGDFYTQIIDNAYVKKDLKKGKKETLISLKDLQRLFPNANFKRLPYLSFTQDDKAHFAKGNQYIWLKKRGKNWKITKTITLNKKAENIHELADNAYIYNIDNNLRFHKDGMEGIITNDENKGIINGKTVHRSEFGITNGIFVSPNKQKVAFYRKDETMVTDYPVIDWSKTPAVNKNIKYPMAGGKSEEVKLGVFDVKTNQKTFLKIDGDKEQYLTAVSWSPDSKSVFVGVLNRGQNHMKLNQYDAKTGEFIKTLFEEKDDKYVEPQHPLLFLPNSKTEFIWQSQRTGYNHLFLYDTKKGFVKQLTEGDWVVTDVLGFDKKENQVIFAGTKETPLENHIYKVNWKTDAIQRLDAGDGVHRAVLSKDGKWLYDTYSNANTPKQVNLINTENLQSKNLLTAKNPLKNYDTPKVENVSLKADDGTDLYGKIIYPTNFDATKKYPAVVYLYNGPHVQLVKNSFPASGNLWYDYMAQHGYVVFTMDGRGSANRGMKFEQAVHRQLGETEMKDQLKGVDYLKSLPFVDAERMGVHGWSFGGFMTTSLMLKYPNVFKVGVAGGPVIDWNMYEIMYTERYMDSPQENPAGYAKANLLDKIDQLKGKLLLIHGTQDDVVVWQHTLKLLKNAVDKNVQLDYFVYPGHAHNVRGYNRVHLMQKITDYFDAHLKK
ncbi:MAG: S9 family peptidase [Flavobacteriales bacterium]|nr:MAG: S9 family peptidase [Flavobacteriales bacterium]